jgi:hypothetical protein
MGLMSSQPPRGNERLNDMLRSTLGSSNSVPDDPSVKEGAHMSPAKKKEKVAKQKESNEAKKKRLQAKKESQKLQEEILKKEGVVIHDIEEKLLALRMETSDPSVNPANRDIKTQRRLAENDIQRLEMLDDQPEGHTEGKDVFS